MKSAVLSRLSTNRRRYKSDSYKKVGWEPTLKGGDYVFRDCSQLTAIASDAADKMASRRFNKLIRQKFGRYRVLIVKRHTVTIEKEGIPNTISTNCRAESPPWEQVTNNLIETTHTGRQPKGNKQRRNAVKDARRAKRSNTTLP